MDISKTVFGLSYFLIYTIRKEVFKIKIYHDIQLSFGTSDVKRTVIKQNSENTHILQIKLYDKQNNEMTIDNNWNIHISALKGDKTHIFNANNISVVDNTIQVMMTKQMLAASGTEKCELVIQDGENVLFSDTFLIYVEPNIQDGSFIESSNEYDSIVDILDHVQEQKDTVDQLTDDIQETYDELADAVEQTNKLIDENEIIKANEQARIKAENTRITNEEKRITDTTTAVTNTETATKKANDAADDLQNKLDSHHFVLTEDKDMANGVPSLDSNTKIPNTELYEATTTSKGITQLTDSISSDSTTTAATPNSVKTVYDKALSIESDINANKVIWNDKYTKNQVDNKFSALETNIDWKESVETYDDITTAYPNPVDGWTVNVKDTDYTYRYNGTKWVVISANAIPKATNDVDGLLSKEDHEKYEETFNEKHTHDNKSVLDGITSSFIDNWNSAKTHADSTHAPSNAEENVIETVKVNGTPLTPSSKAVNVTVPTKVSELTNDSGYVTNASSVTGVKGNAENSYRTGNINLTPANIGLGNVDNTADVDKSVKESKFVEVTNDNEIRFSGNNGNNPHLWFNYLLPDNSQAPTKVTDYYFANGQKTTTGVTLHADNFTGKAETAVKAETLTTSAGSATQPVYFSNGKPVACSYTLGKSVPSNAVFTDTNTTYSAGTGLSLSGTTFSNSGVRSVATGSSNGTISVNTNGTTSNVSVKGLGNSAYLNYTNSVTAKAPQLITSGGVYSALANYSNISYFSGKESVPYNTLTDIFFTPGKGTFFVICYAEFQSTASTGYRGVYLCNSPGGISNAICANCIPVTTMVTAYYPRTTLCGFVTLSTGGSEPFMIDFFQDGVNGNMNVAWQVWYKKVSD